MSDESKVGEKERVAHWVKNREEKGGEGARAAHQRGGMGRALSLEVIGEGEGRRQES